MSKRISKKMQEALKKVDKDKFYDLPEAIKLVKEVSISSFPGSVDLSFNLNLDTRKAEQQLRGAISLPNGTGKVVKVLATTDDTKQQEAAKKAGADIIANKVDLEEILKSGKFNFDVIVTDPKMMPILGKYGKALGPKGLMPNPKTGTVTPNLGKTIEEIKKGKANYRTDKEGIINASIGKTSMDDKKLLENAKTLIDTIIKLKPSTVKGKYILNLTLSPTMGPSVKINLTI